MKSYINNECNEVIIDIQETSCKGYIGNETPTIEHNTCANILFLIIECHQVDYSLIKDLSINDQVPGKFEVLVSNEHNGYYPHDAEVGWLNFQDIHVL